MPWGPANSFHTAIAIAIDIDIALTIVLFHTGQGIFSDIRWASQQRDAAMLAQLEQGLKDHVMSVRLALEFAMSS